MTDKKGSEKLICPLCDSKRSFVIDSRTSTDYRKIRRRRVCLNCDNRFTTYEMKIEDFYGGINPTIKKLIRDKIRELDEIVKYASEISKEIENGKKSTPLDSMSIEKMHKYETKKERTKRYNQEYWEKNKKRISGIRKLKKDFEIQINQLEDKIEKDD